MASMKPKILAARYRVTVLFLYLAIAGAAAPAGAQGYDPTARPGGVGYINPLDPRAGPVGGAVSGPKYDPNDEYAGMPRTEGVESVIAQCSYCHSPFLIMQQRLSRERWDNMIRLMIEEKGMPEPDPADRQVILDYLARYFSGAATAGGPPKQ